MAATTDPSRAKAAAMKASSSPFDSSKALVIMLLFPAILGGLVLIALRFPVTQSNGAGVVPVFVLDLSFGWYQDTKKVRFLGPHVLGAVLQLTKCIALATV